VVVAGCGRGGRGGAVAVAVAVAAAHAATDTMCAVPKQGDPNREPVKHRVGVP
jgi:hypothetical protein